MENKRNKSHGLSGTRLYRIYNNMKSRCYKPYAKEYAEYGGRGITICPEWLDKKNGVVNFYNWSIANGYADNLTLDRIDNDKEYSPKNCRWVTRKVQNNNSRHTRVIEFNGEAHSITEWANIKGMDRNTLAKRLNSGWTIEDALTKPIDNRFSRTGIVTN